MDHAGPSPVHMLKCPQNLIHFFLMSFIMLSINDLLLISPKTNHRDIMAA